MSHKILALIAARGGSKSIPRKNIMPLAGKPMIAYSIQHAQASKYVNRIVVTTDDQEIADISRQWGAEVPFIRPAEFAGDVSPDIDTFRHALNWFKEHENYEPDIIVHLRPTSPVRRVEDIDASVELLMAHPEADAVRSVGVARQTPYKMWKITSEGYMEPLLRIDGMADCQSVGRQILPVVYLQNGVIDILRPRAILEKNSMWGDCVLPLIIEKEGFDVDYPEDIPAVEAFLKSLEVARSDGKPN